MKCINCVDDFGVVRRCCGPSRFTDDEMNGVIALGVSPDSFNITNAGNFSKSQVVGTGSTGQGDDLTYYDISRCVFLSTDGTCTINTLKPEFDCKNYPVTQRESDLCGPGGYEGSGY
jgi:hypothetical protein